MATTTKAERKAAAEAAKLAAAAVAEVLSVPTDVAAAAVAQSPEQDVAKAEQVAKDAAEQDAKAKAAAAKAEQDAKRAECDAAAEVEKLAGIQCVKQVETGTLAGMVGAGLHFHKHCCYYVGGDPSRLWENAVNALVSQIAPYASEVVNAHYVRRMMHTAHTYTILTAGMDPLPTVPYGAYRDHWTTCVEKVNPGKANESYAAVAGAVELFRERHSLLNTVNEHGQCVKLFMAEHKARVAKVAEDAKNAALAEEVAKAKVAREAADVAFQLKAKQDAAEKAARDEQDAVKREQLTREAEQVAQAKREQDAKAKALHNEAVIAAKHTARREEESAKADKAAETAQLSAEGRKPASRREDAKPGMNVMDAKARADANPKDVADMCHGIIRENVNPTDCLMALLRQVKGDSRWSKDVVDAMTSALFTFQRGSAAAELKAKAS